MEKGTKLRSLVTDAGKTAKSLLDGAAQALDQNADGKFDFTDVSILADGVGTAVQKRAQAARETAEERARAMELKSLRPIFPDTLDAVEFCLPKLLRITERDRKHMESAVCQGSVGFESENRGLRIVNIFRDSIEAFGLTFYPDQEYEFYYIDPSERGRYIALDEYFGYLKIARVNELKKIAQDLGAKHFKVTYKEEQTVVSEKKTSSRANVAVVGADTDCVASQRRYTTIDVAAEMTFPGHAPVRPQLRYLQRDPSIQTLIAMRMDANAPLLHEKFMLKMSNSSGLKESDAVKIDTALKKLRCAGSAKMVREAQNEAKRYFEYDIAF